MERQIKFRAWLQDESQMVFSNDQASTDGCEVWIFYDGGLKVQVQETVWREGGGETFDRIEYVDCTHRIMQYTGLADKNGKDIYEGDLVKTESYSDGHCNPIVWKQSACCFCVGESGFSPLYHDRGYEVIGNIHENPDLLK